MSEFTAGQQQQQQCRHDLMWNHTTTGKDDNHDHDHHGTSTTSTMLLDPLLVVREEDHHQGYDEENNYNCYHNERVIINNNGCLLNNHIIKKNHLPLYHNYDNNHQCMDEGTQEEQYNMIQSHDNNSRNGGYGNVRQRKPVLVSNHHHRNVETKNAYDSYHHHPSQQEQEQQQQASCNSSSFAHHHPFIYHQQQQQQQRQQQFRILDRDGECYQSRGRWRIEHISSNELVDYSNNNNNNNNNNIYNYNSKGNDNDGTQRKKWNHIDIDHDLQSTAAAAATTTTSTSTTSVMMKNPLHDDDDTTTTTIETQQRIHDDTNIVKNRIMNHDDEKRSDEMNLLNNTNDTSRSRCNNHVRSNNNNHNNNNDNMDPSSPTLFPTRNNFHSRRFVSSITYMKQFWDHWFYTIVYQRTIVLVLIVFTVYVAIIFLFAGIYLTLSVYGRKITNHHQQQHQKQQHNYHNDYPFHNELEQYPEIQQQHLNIHSTDSNMLPIYLNDTQTASLLTPSVPMEDEYEYYCHMDITNHMEALYFSLSTMTTIGYGVSDYYFGGCWLPFILVLIQVCCSIIFNAIAASILFLKISRGHYRRKSILFSKHAVIHYVNEIPYFMFRVVEVRKHQLFEASVRSYCIKTERQVLQQQPINISTNHNNHHNNNNGDATTTADIPVIVKPLIQSTYFVTKPMSYLQQHSSNILMSLPQVLVHRIDENSPLIPSTPVWYAQDGVEHTWTTLKSSSSLTTSSTAATLSAPPPPSYSVLTSNQERLNPVDEFNVSTNDTRKKNLDHDHFVTDHDNVENKQQQQEQVYQQYQKNMEEYFIDRNIEIIVLLEGTDELTGASIQARHSYMYDDIRWNHTFHPCIFPYHGGNCNNNHKIGNDSTRPNENTEIITESSMLSNVFHYFLRHRGSGQRQRKHQNNIDSRRDSTSIGQGTTASARTNATTPVCLIDFSLFHETELLPTMNMNQSPYV